MKKIKALIVFFVLIIVNNFFAMNENHDDILFTVLERELNSGYWKNLNNIKKIIDTKKININAKNRYGHTAIYLAVNHSDINIAKLLIEYGADLNLKEDSSGWTPLINVARWDNIPMVEFLLKNGANIFLKDRNNKTAYDYAIENGSYISFIINRRKNEIINFKKELISLIEFEEFNEIKEIMQKISMGVYDENGNNPLHTAAFYNKPKIFKLILSIRPSLIGQVNKEGKTPLELNPGIALSLYESLNNKNS